MVSKGTPSKKSIKYEQQSATPDTIILLLRMDVGIVFIMTVMLAFRFRARDVSICHFGDSGLCRRGILEFGVHVSLTGQIEG